MSNVSAPGDCWFENMASAPNAVPNGKSWLASDARKSSSSRRQNRSLIEELQMIKSPQDEQKQKEKFEMKCTRQWQKERKHQTENERAKDIIAKVPRLARAAARAGRSSADIMMLSENDVELVKRKNADELEEIVPKSEAVKTVYAHCQQQGFLVAITPDQGEDDTVPKYRMEIDWY